MENPELSIITPVYNAKRFLHKNLQSVLNQSFSNWEHILIDDGSSDGSWPMLEKARLEDRRRVVVQNLKNLGAAQTRNKGIEKARGRFIAFLDADDWWDPEFCFTMLNFAKENKHPFIFSSYRRFEEANSKIHSTYTAPIKVNRAKMLKSNWIPCLTAIYDSHFFGKRLMPEIRARQDWALWLELLKETEFAYAQPQMLANYLLHSDSLSANKGKMMGFQWKLYAKLGIAPIKRVWLLLNWAYFGLTKYKKA